MSTFNLYLIILLVILVNLILSLLVIRKFGFSGWWAILTCIPFINIILLWILAYIEWPSYPDHSTDESIKALREENLALKSKLQDLGVESLQITPPISGEAEKGP